LVFEENAIFCRRKLAKIAENSHHNIEPSSAIKKTCPKHLNNRPMGENSSNPVTLRQQPSEN
jgi:hypothetical protein